MVLLIKCNTKKKEINFLLKKTRKYLKKNRFLLLNKFKKKDLITKNCRKSPFLHRELQKTDRNLHFFTENYKKLSEISISPQRITKNRRKSPFFHRELQKIVCGELFSSQESLYIRERIRFFTFLKIFIEKNKKRLIFYLFTQINQSFVLIYRIIREGLLSLCLCSEVIVSFQEIREGFFCDGFGSELFIFEISDTNNFYRFLRNAIRIANAECLFSQIWICYYEIRFLV